MCLLARYSSLFRELSCCILLVPQSKFFGLFGRLLNSEKNCPAFLLLAGRKVENALCPKYEENKIKTSPMSSVVTCLSGIALEYARSLFDSKGYLVNICFGVL